MMTDEKIKNIIEKYIESTEELGEQTGGSGHKGYISYSLSNYSFEKIVNDIYSVTFKYIISTETEFTYYPDNPPMETEYVKKITIDENGEIISEEELESSSSKFDEELIDPYWFEAQDEITKYTEELLSNIEWNYGDNRAPFKYPPKYELAEGKYRCTIELEDKGGNLIYENDNPRELSKEVKADLAQRYSTSE